MNRIIAAIAIIVALIAGGAWWYSQSAAPAVAESAAPAATETAAAPAENFGIQDMVEGNLDAKVTVIEYASFTCPHCANFATGVLPELKKNYIDTGKIKFVYREVYFDKYGLWGSLLARCSGPEKFFGMADLLYKGQKTWAQAADPVSVANELRKIGRLAGMAEDKIEQCLNDEEQQKNLIQWYQANATADGIDSTPSFVINGQKYSNMSYADFSALLDQKLAE